jgi:hypothetical protein
VSDCSRCQALEDLQDQVEALRAKVDALTGLVARDPMVRLPSHPFDCFGCEDWHGGCQADMVEGGPYPCEALPERNAQGELWPT